VAPCVPAGRRAVRCLTHSPEGKRVVLANAQASVSDPDSRPEGDLSSAPLCGASRVMITVRMALIVMVARCGRARQRPVRTEATESKPLFGAEDGTCEVYSA
jgi:hypothetical protein